MKDQPISDNSIFSVISELQADALEKIGVPRDRITDHLLNIFKERMSYDPDKDLEIIETYSKEIPTDQLYTSLRKSLDLANLPYQCPHTYLFLNIWQRRYFEDLSPEDIQNILESTAGGKYNPVLASAYTGRLNATSVRAPDGTRGLVFEDELLNLFQIAAMGIAGLIFQADDDKIIFTLEPDEHIKNEERYRRSYRLLFGALNAMLVQGSIMQASGGGYRLPISTTTELSLATHIARGMFNYVYSHEWGHILAQHSELMAGTTDRHIPRRTIPEQEEAIEKYKKNYSTIFPDLSPIQVNKFLTWQMIEIEADLFAHYKVLAECRRINEGDDRQRVEKLCSIIGALSVLPLFVSIENIAISVAYGDQDYPSALLLEDDLVQNLCLRSTHPTPLNRIKNIIGAFRNIEDDGTDVLAEYTETYISLFEGLAKLLDKAFSDWLTSEDGLEAPGFGPDALKPHWRGLLDELPKPL